MGETQRNRNSGHSFGRLLLFAMQYSLVVVQQAINGAVSIV